MADYIITTKHPSGRDLYLSRRQDLGTLLLNDSVTANLKGAFRWTDADGSSYNLADATLFLDHANANSPEGVTWALVEA